MNKLLSIIIIPCLFGVINKTEAQLKFSGEIRPRFEFRNGYKELRDSATSPAYFVGQRSRLNLIYKSDRITTGFSLQDVRIWGDQRISTQKANIGLHEGWVEYAFSEKTSVKCGRQELSYGNKRLLSVSDWGHSAAAHDAVYLKYYNNSLKIDAGGAFNQAKEQLFGTDYSPMEDQYKTMVFLGINKSFGEKTSLSSFSLSDGFQKTGNPGLLYKRATSGLIFKHNFSNIDIFLQGYYQFGKSKTGKEISAYFINSEVKLNLTKKIITKLGMEYFSGNDQMKPDGKDHAFDILYGTRHTFNGIMDYYGTQVQTKYAGLKDFFIDFNFTTPDNGLLTLSFHHFLLSNNYLNQNQLVSNYLGTEIDLIFTQKINSIFTAECGYAVMFPGVTAGIIKGGDHSKIGHYGYVMLTFKPVFYQGKN